MYARYPILVHEIGKFGLVGIGSTIITLLIQYALYGYVGPTTAVVIANALATVFAYTGNRYWAFRHRKNARMGRETVLFIIFNVIGTLIQSAFVDVNRYLLHNTDRYSPLIASAIGIVFATLFRLYRYRKFVFSAVPANVEEAGTAPLRRCCRECRRFGSMMTVFIKWRRGSTILLPAVRGFRSAVRIQIVPSGVPEVGDSSIWLPADPR
jgi:putative flippase GtrA